MKKLFLTITLAFASILLTQCRKNYIQPVQNDTPEAELVEFSLSASSGDDKASIDGFTINWSVGDKVFVVDMDASGNGLLGCLSAVSGGTTTTEFKGGITAPAAGHRCIFYYVGSNTFTLNGSGQYEYNVGEQYGALNGTNSVAKMLLMKSNTVTVTAAMLMNHNFGSSAVTFKSMIAVSRLSFTKNSSAYTGNVTMKGGYSSAKLNPKDGTLSIVAGNVTLKSVSSNYFVTLIPANQNTGGGTLNLSFVAASEDCEEMSIAPTVAAGMLYNYSSAKVINMVWPVETDKWINFGLPSPNQNLKWSKKNIGATNGSTAQSWYGDYYAWGETSTKSNYAWSTYKWCNGSYNTLTKYNTSSSYGTVDNKTTLEYSDDVARQHASWGGSWRMPTGGASGEWNLLKDNTLFVWTTNYRGISNLKGYVVYKVKATAHKGQRVESGGTGGYTGYSGYTYALTDPHMFLPIAGYFSGTSLDGVGSEVSYWSSSLRSESPEYAYRMWLHSEVKPQSYSTRCLGFSVRPVRPL